jgi:hypothetical protein
LHKLRVVAIADTMVISSVAARFFLAPASWVPRREVEACPLEAGTRARLFGRSDH